jgi:hypothetical protein
MKRTTHPTKLASFLFALNEQQQSQQQDLQRKGKGDDKDEELGMIISNLRQIESQAKELQLLIRSRGGTPEWSQEKIAVCAADLNSVHENMKHSPNPLNESDDDDDGQEEEQEATVEDNDEDDTGSTNQQQLSEEDGRGNNSAHRHHHHSPACYACLMETIAEATMQPLEEAEYQGRKVALNKPTRGDVKKFKVFVKDPSTGNVKKVNFGDPNMTIKKSNPKRKKSFRARHRCQNPGPKTKAKYWSCRAWS